MKRSGKNYLYVVLYNVLGVITPLITAPYISRIIGADGVGTYSYYYAIAYYFTLMAKMGLTNYGTRRIAEVKDDKELLSKEFSSIYIMQIIFGIFISILYFILVYTTYRQFKLIGIIFGIWVFGNVFNLDWFLFGNEKFKKTSMINIIIKVLELISIFIFIQEKNDVWKYCLIMTVGYIISYLYFCFVGLKISRIQKVKIKDVMIHFKPCMILMIPVIALNIYRSMDKVMLGYLSDLNQTGYYENAEKIIYTLTMFISSLGTVMMPKMSSMISKGKKNESINCLNRSLNFVYFITSAMCFGVLAISNSLIPWFFGDEFYGSIVLIEILAITLIFIGIGNVVRTQYIIPSKKDSIYIKSISYGAIINLIINFILIPKYQAIGACIATVCAEVFVPIYQCIKVKDAFNIKYTLKNGIYFGMSGLIMLLILKLIEVWIGSGFLTLIVQIFVGGIIYIGLTYTKISKIMDFKISDLIKKR